jgi:ATP-dependent protease ClpP protease subunit
MDNIVVSIPERANTTIPDPSLLWYYEDLEDRVYQLVGEVDEGLLDFSRHVIRWNREDKGKPVEERKPIKLFFFSPGGSLDINYSVIDIIRLSKTPIIGINMGVCCSAAAYIYLACHKRYMLPHSYFVFHQGSSQMSGTYGEVVAIMTDYQNQVAELSSFMEERTTYTSEEITDNIVTEWYVREEEALEKGVCHEVIEDIEVLL